MENLQNNQSNSNSSSLSSNQESESNYYSQQIEKTKNTNKREMKKGMKRGQKFCRQMMRQLIDKYFISISKEQYQRLIGCTEQFKLKHPTLKCMRELSCSIFYFYYSDIIQFYNTKQFCVMNGLNNKVFNKRYIKCCSYFKRDKEIFHSLQTSSSVKNQQIQSKLQGNQNFQNKEIAQHIKKIDFENLSIVGILDTIYDDLFRKPQFQANRRQIIVKMAEICNNYEYANAQALKTIIAGDSRLVRCLYIIFYNFRKYGARYIQFTQFKNVVNQKLHAKLKREQFITINKILDDYTKRVATEEDACKKQPDQQVQYHFF